MTWHDDHWSADRRVFHEEKSRCSSIHSNALHDSALYKRVSKQLGTYWKAVSGSWAVKGMGGLFNLEQSGRSFCCNDPDGGRYAHLDQYCRSVHQKYLPLNKVEYTDEIAHKYELCPVCCIHPWKRWRRKWKIISRSGAHLLMCWRLSCFWLRASARQKLISIYRIIN